MRFFQPCSKFSNQLNASDAGDNTVVRLMGHLPKRVCSRRYEGLNVRACLGCKSLNTRSEQGVPGAFRSILHFSARSFAPANILWIALRLPGIVAPLLFTGIKDLGTKSPSGLGFVAPTTTGRQGAQGLKQRNLTTQDLSSRLSLKSRAAVKLIAYPIKRYVA